MRRYGGGILYAALPLHMQRGCFRIRTHYQNNLIYIYIYIYQLKSKVCLKSKISIEEWKLKLFLLLFRLKELNGCYAMDMC